MDLGQPSAPPKGIVIDFGEWSREMDLGQPSAPIKGTLSDCGEWSWGTEDNHDIISVILDKFGILFARRSDWDNNTFHNFIE